MRFLLLVYTDEVLMDRLPAEEFDSMMRGCLEHTDELKEQGRFLGAQQLEPPTAARTVRVREGRATITDGPFAETKEVLAGFNLIEAESLEDAVRMAHEFPWTRVGAIEVRPIRDIDAVRRRVGA